MMGYLQRLLDSAAPSGAPSATLSSEAPPGLTPVLRSDSPVFADDQLLGLEAFGDGEAEPELPLAAPDAPGLESTHPAPEADMPTASPPGVIRPSGPFTQSGFTRSGPAPIPIAQRPEPADRVEALIEPGTVFEDMPQSHRPPVRSPDETPEPVVGPEAAPRPAPATPDSVMVAPSVRPTVADPGSAVNLEPFEGLPDIPPQQPDAAPPLSETPQPAPIREISPRPRPYFDESARQEHAESGAEAAILHRAPRINIGQVIVEVLPPPASSPRPPQPVTAEAASLIGPIGDLRAARRLFALRRV